VQWGKGAALAVAVNGAKGGAGAVPDRAAAGTE